MERTADVIIVGAGIVGSAIAYFTTLYGLKTIVVDRGLPANGTSSACEGNILVSDKELGPELELTQYSLRVWKEDLQEFGHLWEFESKGGIIVASKESSLASLQRFSESQRAHGITATALSLDELRELEPNIRPTALGASWYPEDAQVQPMLATFHLLRMARERGAKFYPNTPVQNIMVAEDNSVRGIQTNNGEFYAPVIVNAAGTWAGEVAKTVQVDIPINPRRGFVMVTVPLPPMVFHKVYAAEYVDNVGSSDAGLQSSPVVEGTPAGSILIGSSRERVGFDQSISVQALQTIATNAIELFPFLAKVKILRHYHGFRPYCPDHLPVIGHDTQVPGLVHAAGHEGAGIGLSVGTGKLVAQAILGHDTDLPLDAFTPDRFLAASGAHHG
ncbi:NAD(P)/FAD-dependent oxidoreductase [Corynebacterium freiburgense]|uniref:NAD(P)/FAD-dependent oxidoreductase n=1 Tax=Corynebacterium freiburgense TaxID=556548 RepID=UPI0004214BC4|nr:FAD-binding oxidoreductase [Corynebacterium freiburgense]WJZ02618.1 Hydrogen cyanide synthase subunit HcnC precursor [Corynebacterium freiburgense]